MKLTAPTTTTAGSILSHTFALVDRSGSGNFASQVAVPAGTTVNYDILGRVDPSLPWVALKSSQTGGFLESVGFVPFFAIRINSIAGTDPVVFMVSEN